MQLYFIRHAQSENNLLWAQTGSSEWRSEDPPLTATGQKQAEYLAEALTRPGVASQTRVPAYDPQNVEGFGVTHLYCSLMIRAVETGTVVARALDLPLVAWSDLHEVGGIHTYDKETGEHNGLPGKGRAYFETHHPELLLPESLDAEGWWNRAFETREERPHRARRFLDDLLARHGDTDHRVAVISHGGFYNYVMRALLDLPQEDVPWFAFNNVAITHIDFGEERIGIQYTNRVDHLPATLVT